MTDVDEGAAEEIAAVGKALGGAEKSVPIEERYPEAPEGVLETIEYVEDKLDSIEERLAEKERQREKRAEFVAELAEDVEALEAKIEKAEQYYGV